MRKLVAQIFDRRPLTETLDIKRFEEKATLDISEFYDSFEKVGIRYDASFQVIKSAFVADKTVFVQLSTELSTKGYAIHPAMLDGCFQACALLPHQDDDATNKEDFVYLPIGLRRFTVLHKPGNYLYAKVCSGEQSEQMRNADIWIYDRQGQCCVLIEGFTTKRILKSDLLKQLHPTRELSSFLYTFNWQQLNDLNTYTLPNTDQLRELKEIKDECIKQYANFWREHDLESYQKGFELINQQALAYIQKALMTLGMPQQVGATFIEKSLAESLGIAPIHERLFQRLLNLLSTHGYFSRNADTLTLIKAFDLPIQLLPEFYQESHIIEWTLLERCGQDLPNILQNKSEALAYLFPEGTAISAANLYKDPLGAQALNQQLALSIQLQLAHWPKEKPVRILEIGAGTGGTTHGVLNELKDFKLHYVFTDISKTFLDKAKEIFKEQDGMFYALLNIENDPREQGFAPEQFDFIIAANVLHATKDIVQTLQHARLLLSPKGRLMLYEAIMPAPWLDITFGLLDGWWRFEDAHLRQDNPLLAIDHWNNVLAQTSFEEVINTDPELGACIIVAKASNAHYILKREMSPWLLICDQESESIAQKFGDVLEQSGEVVEIIPASMLSTLNDKQAHCVIYLPALATKNIKNCDPTSLMSEEKRLCEGMIELCKACFKHAINTNRLVAITKSTQSVDGREAINPIPATLWGMCRSLRNEMADLECVTIDIENTEDLSRLFTSLYYRGAADQLALRDEQIFRLELVRSLSDESILESDNYQFSPNKWHVITGGLGGIGLALCRWMVLHGAHKIVLIARREANESEHLTISDIKILGATVEVAVLDLTNVNQLMDLFSDRDLGVIVHAAGVLADAFLQNQNWDLYQQVFNAKVAAMQGLHLSLMNKDYDALLLCSSVAGIFGPHGQSNHAAANSYLDSYAYWMQTQGKAVQTINWGAWSEIGYAARHGADKRTGALGYIAPNEGLNIFKEVLQHPQWKQTIVSPIDWAQMNGQGVLPDWLSAFVEQGSIIESSVLLQELEQISEQERPAILKRFLRQQAADVLGIAQADNLSEEAGFFEMGMDSLMSVELRNRIQAAIGNAATVPTTFAFENANISKMSENLLQMLNLGQARAQITYLAQATTEPMAIIGMSCRFPQGANSIAEFWQKLKEGEDLVTEIPSSRWNVDEYYSAESAPDKMYTRMGAFLDVDVSLFDAGFFGISPKEAEMMDPQQRLLLEVVWEALEDSGIAPKSLKERQIGFFLGQMNHDYSFY